MGVEREFNKVKLFTGIIFKDRIQLNKVIEIFSDRFSAVDSESDIIPFDMTDYYHPEMGSPLFRKFISFQQLIHPQQLSGIKIFSNRVEAQFSDRGRRRFNIDPGFVSEANVILATTKNHYHRIPLQEGVYAHMEYTIRKKKVVPLEWTYPDFKKKEYMNFFNRLISLYKQQVQQP